MVSGFDVCDYVSFDGNEIVIVPVSANKPYQEELKKKAIDFWNMVLNKTPPETAELIIEDMLLEADIDRFIEIRKNIASLEEDLNDLKEKIKSQVRSGTALCGGYKLQYISKKGNVEYAKIPELNGVNLDQYRKPDTVYFDIRKVKDGEQKTTTRTT